VAVVLILEIQVPAVVQMVELADAEVTNFLDLAP
jgi:hypothetical protein